MIDGFLEVNNLFKDLSGRDITVETVLESLFG